MHNLQAVSATWKTTNNLLQWNIEYGGCFDDDDRNPSMGVYFDDQFAQWRTSAVTRFFEFFLTTIAPANIRFVHLCSLWDEHRETLSYFHCVSLLNIFPYFRYMRSEKRNRPEFSTPCWKYSKWLNKAAH